MKIVNFSSGLGNQIYFYLYYKYLEEKYPKHHIYGYYNKKNLIKHNGLELENVFDVSLPLQTHFSYFIATLCRILDKIGFHSVICTDNRYSEHAVFFNGWWQDKRFFLDNVSKIRFKVDDLDETNKDLLKQIVNSTSVSIHVRRGDYLDPAFMKRAGYCSIEYYKNAIEIAKNKLGKVKFFVFSNDIEWVKEKLDLDDAVYVSNNSGANSYLDMYLMTFCKGNIIANSSFSYWGALLNNIKNNLVIYPSKWFHTKTPDIFPDSWIGIEGLK